MMNTNYTAQEIVSPQRLRHFFTPEEADRSLVLVRRIVADVIGHYERLLEVHDNVEALEAAGQFGQIEDTRDELVITADKIRVCLEEIDDVGAELCDWELGIVDFPAMIDGREVRLCWRSDERQVTHWHELDSCHLGRYEIATRRGARATTAAR